MATVIVPGVSETALATTVADNGSLTDNGTDTMVVRNRCSVGRITAHATANEDRTMSTTKRARNPIAYVEAVLGS